MKILILGASSPTSIGYRVGQLLQKEGYSVVCASRSGKIGYRCDVTNPNEVKRLFREEQPEAVIFAVGTFPPRQELGDYHHWQGTKALIEGKVFGSLVVVDAALKSRVLKLVFFGGSDISSDPGFGHFSLVNGALWSLVQFVNRHTSLEAFYFELGVVRESSMAEKYLKSLPSQNKKTVEGTQVSCDAVYKKLQIVLRGRKKRGSRIKINNDYV